MCDRAVTDNQYPEMLSAAGMPVTVGNLLDMATGEMFPWSFLTIPRDAQPKIQTSPVEGGS